MPYQHKPLKAPRAAGFALRLTTPLVEHPPLGGVLAAKLLKDIGITELRSLDCHEALPFRPPLAPRRSAFPEQERPLAQWLELALAAPAPERSTFCGARQLAAALSAGRVTATELAKRSLAWQRELEQGQPPLRALVAQDEADVLDQAGAADRRRDQGQVVGPLEGIPVAVKDEIDQRGYPTSVGTSFLGREPAADDAEVVARLRAAGAVLVGKANMHEIGLGVTGINPHLGPARNPYDPQRITGGSSSGPAAAVAAGLVPLAVGADGGGSVRIPAALCGLFGLKPTFGRLSEHGAAPLCWSVAHIGPLAATAADCALGYLVMAGPDDKDPNTSGQPPVHLQDFDSDDLSGLRLGVMPSWFDSADAEVLGPCRQALEVLRQAGAQIVEIDIAELELVRAVHLAIIVSEMTAAHLQHYREHRRAYGHDTRINLALARRLHAFDYIQAQRLRLRICRHFQTAHEQADVIVSPATGCTAPPLRQDALHTGESDLVTTERIMRFAPAANLTGLPALSVPVGSDARGLPVGLQLMGRAFEEHLLLRLGRILEMRRPRPRPALYRSLLAAGQS